MTKFTTTKSNVELLRASDSFIFLATEPSKLVGNHNIELGSSLDNFLPLLGGYIMGNLCTVFSAKHGRMQ